MRRTRHLSAFLGASLAALAVQIGSAAAEDKVSLRLDWTTLGYHAPFYYGAAKGFYKEAGLEVDIGEGKGSSSTITLVGNKADDFGFADATTAARLVSASGVPVKVAMGIFQRSTLSLFFPKGKLNTPQDLAGKRIALCAGDGIAVYIPAYIKAINLKPSDVSLLNFDCSVKYATVARGQADVVASYGTAGKPLLEAVGVAEVGKFDFADAGISLPSHGIVVARDTIAAKADLVRRFVAATGKAWEAARQNPDAAVAAVIAAKPLLKDKDALLKSTFLEALQYLGGTPGKPFGWQSPEDWSKAEQTLVEFTGVAKVAPEEFYTNEFR